jgi:hypothetical protein
MKKVFLAAISSVFFINCFAENPIFLVTPNIHAQSSLINGETGTAVYQVTNNTSYTFTNIGLAQMPGGVVPNTNSASSFSTYCTNPFTLTPGASCLLKVQLNASQLNTSVYNGPTVCYSQSRPVYCSQPYSTEQINTTLLQGTIPQDCNSNIANFNYELTQNLDSTTSFTTGWGPTRNDLPISSSNPDLSNCMVSAGNSWSQQRIVAAAQFWIAQKLNYCHHYNPDYQTPVDQRGAGGSSGGYCNPAVDSYPGSVYYGQQARWNYSGQGSETANNWVNNNQMWYGMDCSNYTSFLYNFAFGPNSTLGIPFNSDTGFQAGQSGVGCTGPDHNMNCPQDHLSPNQQQFPGMVLDNDQAAGKLVCHDGTYDPDPKHPSMCTGHGGYLSAISASNGFLTVTVDEVAKALLPGDILYIAGGGTNPDGSTSEVTHAIMWLGLQAGYGPTNINPSLIAPDDGACADPSIWMAQQGDWLISDSHYQGADYRKLTPCFYLNNLWGVRRVLV